MAKNNNLVGRRFGHLHVVARAGSRSGNARWLCVCDCGSRKEFVGCNLKSGGTVSCGCHRDELVSRVNHTHGRTHTREYVTWLNMRARCSNPARREYARYGGRGIVVCPRWAVFENFLADMGACPSASHSIDRIDNAGNYEPGNCRWATRTQQNGNKMSNRRITCAGETLILAEWARRTGIGRSTIRYRLASGWSVKDALGIKEPSDGGRGIHSRGVDSDSGEVRQV